MKSLPLILATAATLFAVPAYAQDRDTSEDFDGLYVGGSIGYTVQGNDTGSTLIFDTNRDGTFTENVNTTTGANAFSPGFCNGYASTGVAANGCTNDRDDKEYFGRIGLDKRMGNFVVGAVIEGGRSEAADAVSGFSTTPASYTIVREAMWNAGARLRAGYTPGGGVLFYATGGGAYAKLKNSFLTTNGANAFTGDYRTDAWGYSAGGGAEAMLTKNISLGLEYLYTDVDNDDFVVGVSQGTAPATNPFLLNGGGTNIMRSDQAFRTHSIRANLNFRF